MQPTWICECADTHDSQEWKPLPVAWRFGSLFSGSNYWNADRGGWIMDCPTVAQRSTQFLPFPQTATPAVVCTTHPLFSTPERCWQGANHHWVFEWLNTCTCVGACVLCGNVGSACSPRAMLINALQTKCSPFSLFCSLLHCSHPLLSSSLLSGHCRERRRRWCWGTG